MTEFYHYDGFCLCPMGGDLPQGTCKVEVPFAPLVFLVHRPPCFSRGFFAISDLWELTEPEGPLLLCTPPGEDVLSPLVSFVKTNGATVLNTAFARSFSVLKDYYNRKTRPLRLTLVGLGDVGGALLAGLKLLGEGIFEIGIYDPSEAQCARYEMELNQVLPVDEEKPLPQIVIRNPAQLFDCDALLFTASRGVPALDSEVKDVRMAQYEANRQMLESYAKQARDSGFTGLFAQVSDPVDLLSRWVFAQSNRSDAGEFDAQGLLPEQVQGYGLGVMRARALYYAEKIGVDAAALCAYGPHGDGLVIANAPNERYDDSLSCTLTAATIAANQKVRALGFKPYIAPGLSSACVSLLRTLRGQWHDGAVTLGDSYFGCTTRFSSNGPEVLRRSLCDPLFARLLESYTHLKELDASCSH